MTATDELRRMLDERGVEYVAEDEPSVGLHFTSWDADGFMWEADDRDKRIYLSADRLITPEQAIAATLGTGTCRNSAPTYLDFLCSECGFVHYHSDENDSGYGNEWRFCPNCGRKVVDE